MRSKWIDFESPLANGIRAFLAYKRSLDRKYHTEEKNLRLLDRYLVKQKIIHTNNITPDILDSFVASRQRTGINPSSRLFHLSTFLGHVSPVSTAVYLTITDELLAEANSKFEHFAFHPLQEERA